MKNKQYPFIVAGAVVLVLAVGILLWHPWSAGPVATPRSQTTAAPTIPQVPLTPAGYAAKLSPSAITITVPGKQRSVTITAKEITAVHHDALAAAIKAIQAGGSSIQGVPSSPTQSTNAAGSSSGSNANINQNTKATGTPVGSPSSPTIAANQGGGGSAGGGLAAGESASDYLQELAQTMGSVPMSTSYTTLFGATKVYFAAKGTPNTDNQGKLAVFSYDPNTGVTQIAVLPDAGVQSISNVAF